MRQDGRASAHLISENIRNYSFVIFHIGFRDHRSALASLPFQLAHLIKRQSTIYRLSEFPEREQ